MVGGDAKGRRPASGGAGAEDPQQLEQVAALPKAKQRVIAQVLDAMLAQSSN